MVIEEYYSPYEIPPPNWLSVACEALDEIGNERVDIEIQKAKMALAAIECSSIQPFDRACWVAATKDKPKRILMKWEIGDKRNFRGINIFVTAKGVEDIQLGAGVSVARPPDLTGLCRIQAIRAAIHWYFEEAASVEVVPANWR